MTRAHDEIKKDLNDALPCHIHFHKGDPEPHLTHLNYHALECLHADALAYIQQLEDKVEELNRVWADLAATNMELRDAVFKQELHMRRLEEERSEFESRVPRWISVEERLPEVREVVAIVVRIEDDENLRLGWINGMREWRTVEGCVDGTVTQWLRIPDWPEVKGV